MRHTCVRRGRAAQLRQVHLPEGRSGLAAPLAPRSAAQDKQEFAAACHEFAEEHFLRTYSLVGTRGDCDLMVRAVAPSLDPDPRAPRAPQPERAAALGRDLALLPGDDQGVRLLRRADRRSSRARARTQVPDRLPDVEEARVVRAARARSGCGSCAATSRSAAATRDDRHQHRLLVRARRPGVRRLLQHRRPGRVPRPGPGAARTESSAYTESETPIFTCIGGLPSSGRWRARRRGAGRQSQLRLTGLLRGLEQLLEAAELHARAALRLAGRLLGASIASQPA